jgi:hypothetical protein
MITSDIYHELMVGLMHVYCKSRVSSQNLERNVGMWEGPWKCGIFSKNVGISGKM